MRREDTFLKPVTIWQGVDDFPIPAFRPMLLLMRETMADDWAGVAIIPDKEARDDESFKMALFTYYLRIGKSPEEAERLTEEKAPNLVKLILCSDEEIDETFDEDEEEIESEDVSSLDTLEFEPLPETNLHGRFRDNDFLIISLYKKYVERGISPQIAIQKAEDVVKRFEELHGEIKKLDNPYDFHYSLSDLKRYNA